MQRGRWFFATIRENVNVTSNLSTVSPSWYGLPYLQLFNEIEDYLESVNMVWLYVKCVPEVPHTAKRGKPQKQHLTTIAYLMGILLEDAASIITSDCRIYIHGYDFHFRKWGINVRARAPTHTICTIVLDFDNYQSVSLVPGLVCLSTYPRCLNACYTDHLSLSLHSQPAKQWRNGLHSLEYLIILSMICCWARTA